MKKILAVTMLAAAAFTTTPASAGCVEDHLIVQEPGPEPVFITRDPETGAITIHPPNTVFQDVAILVLRTSAFVNCVV